MQELIELREFIEQYGKDANGTSEVYLKCNYPMESVHFYGRYVTSLEIINQLDLILNNSVVKPSERRSPTDESFSGCKPPDERQNPEEEKSELEENFDDRNKLIFYKFCPECSCFY